MYAIQSVCTNLCKCLYEKRVTFSSVTFCVRASLHVYCATACAYTEHPSTLLATLSRHCACSRTAAAATISVVRACETAATTAGAISCSGEMLCSSSRQQLKCSTLDLHASAPLLCRTHHSNLRSSTVASQSGLLVAPCYAML
jgi:hypothetical protein